MAGVTAVAGSAAKISMGAITFGASSMVAKKKPSLAYIETNYQVAQEATRNWSPKLGGFIPIGRLGGQRVLTITEGKLLDNLTRDRGLVGLQNFKNIADDAFNTADARVPPGNSLPKHVEAAIEAQVKNLPEKDRDAARAALRRDLLNSWPRNDGHNDAFRHAYWNARLTAEFGEKWTAQFATAHEGSNPGNSTREAMDLYNNEVGRRIAKQNPNASPRELADLVKKALDNGELVVIDKNGRLQWSNNVPLNDHGITIQLDRAPDRIQTPDGNASAK